MTPKIFTEWDEETIINFIKDALFRQRKKLSKNGNNGYTEQEHQVRRDYICALFTKGMTKKKVRGYLRETFGIADSTAFDWIEDAIDYLTEDKEEVREYHLNVARERLTDIYNKAIENNEKKVAIQAQQELNKINGLHVDNINLKTDATLKFNFGND